MHQLYQRLVQGPALPAGPLGGGILQNLDHSPATSGKPGAGSQYSPLW